MNNPLAVDAYRRIVVKKGEDGVWQADRPGLSGMPTIGRGDSWAEAIGMLVYQAQGELDFNIKVQTHPVVEGHRLYMKGDRGVPSQILDRNGDIVLSMCCVCGAAERELEELECTPRKE